MNEQQDKHDNKLESDGAVQLENYNTIPSKLGSKKRRMKRSKNFLPDIDDFEVDLPIAPMGCKAYVRQANPKGITRRRHQNVTREKLYDSPSLHPITAKDGDK